MRFDESTQEAAAWIDAGGLKVEECYSQVSYTAHSVLADINRLGFLTICSQEGDTSEERAYIIGFMKRTAAGTFVEKLNRTTDKVAIILHEVRDDLRSPIPVTAYGGRTYKTGDDSEQQDVQFRQNGQPW